MSSSSRSIASTMLSSTVSGSIHDPGAVRRAGSWMLSVGRLRNGSVVGSGSWSVGELDAAQQQFPVRAAVRLGERVKTWAGCDSVLTVSTISPDSRAACAGCSSAEAVQVRSQRNRQFDSAAETIATFARQRQSICDRLVETLALTDPSPLKSWTCRMRQTRCLRA